MDKQLTQQLENAMSADNKISGGLIVDEYGLLLAAKNTDPQKSYLIKSIADAAMNLKKDEEELPVIVIETTQMNTIIKQNQKYYIALERKNE